MDQEKLARLPKWAQRQIENDQLRIKNLEAHIAKLSESQPDSNVKVSSHIYDDYGLPKDSQVDFYLGDSPYRKHRDMITVQILRTKDRKLIRVSTSGQIIVRPTGGSNVIEVTVEPH